MDDPPSLRGFGGGAVKSGLSKGGGGRSAGGALKSLGVLMFSRRSEAGGALGVGGALAVRTVACGAAGNCYPV